ncbi:MAG: AI-2E family transporter [Chthoniobacterales bacterium]
MERTKLNGSTLRTAFVLVLVTATSLLFLAILWPFLTPLLLAAILSSLCQPLYLAVTRLLGGRASLGALLTLLILFLVVAGPLSAFVGLVVRQAVSVTNDAIPWVQSHFGAAAAFNAHDWLVARFPSLATYVPDQNLIMENVGNAAKAAGTFLVAGVSRMTASTAIFLLDLFVMLYAMFYFLRDGQKILERIFYYAPLDHKDEARLLQRFTSVTRATIKGTLVIGVLQGTLAGLGFWAAGIEGAAFWGTMMTVLSVVPGIGSALVWVPGMAYLFLTGRPLAATLLLIWCSAIVGTIDNLLRPRLVGKDAKIPDLLILLGTLGGIFLFGPIGFIVGPIVCGLFLTVLEIYGTTFRDILPPVRSLATGRPLKSEPILPPETSG